jgi:hypothetical protein
MRKRCRKCGRTRLLKFFYEHPNMKDGRLNFCATCVVAGNTARYRANPEKYRVKNRLAQQQWRANNPGRQRELVREWQKKNRPHYLKLRRESHYRRKYGIEMSKYLTMVKLQKGRCLICKGKPQGKTERTKKLQVDHDHKTGRVRGLLCINCNRALGYFKDDPMRIKAAIHYLN